MIYKPFGKTGKQVSAVGFGGMQFDTTQPREKNAQMLLHAWEKGINYFDTAPQYCQDQSEDIFGLAMKQMARQRNKFHVSTKAFPATTDTADKARQAVEKSLGRLNLDKIDFFYVWCVRKMEQYHQAMKKGGMYEGLLKCKSEGLIDHILISTHLPGHQISEVLSHDEFDGVLMGINILNFPYRWAGVQKAYEMGLGVLAMNPLAGGAIPRFADRFTFLAGVNETPVEAALRFCISCPQITVALNGFTTREHIDTACKVAENCRPFSPADIDRIKRHIAENMNAICTGCGYCLSSCPQNIPIASYLQYYNEKLLFDKDRPSMVQGLDHHLNWGLMAGRLAETKDCIECGRCQEECTQHLNIIERLQEIAQWEAEFKALPTKS